jgi:hypothetical protein
MTAKAGDIYLGVAGSEALISAFGRTLSISDKELARKEQCASGRQVKDVVASKKQIKLTYESIDGADLIQLIDIYETFSELSIWIYHTDEPETLTTEEPSSYCDAYTVLMEPLDRDRLLLAGPNDEGVWTGVVVEFNEV